MEPLGWDEIVSQPGMGGYLSFLNGPVPLPHLAPAPEVESAPVAITAPEPETHPALETSTPTGANAGVGTTRDPGVESAPRLLAATPQVETAPGGHLDTVPGATAGIVTFTDPVVAYAPVVNRQPRIRKCQAAHDGHSLGEEVLYQALWKSATAETEESRTIVIGWRGMSQLCRMTPKNCKINTQRLIRKLALEVLSPYNTPESIGTTYRVYSADAILRRRREHGLQWVVRSRGVDFVDPTTGASMVAHLCGYASK